MNNTAPMKKILVVEDDVSIRELLVDVLESEGYQVMAGANGFEGIKILETVTPDLILMDTLMPIMDGYAFRREQMKNPSWNTIPVLMMSAQDQAKEKLENHGIKNFINKPLELDNLLETVRALAFAPLKTI